MKKQTTNKNKSTYVQPVCKSFTIEGQQIIATSNENLDEEDFPWG